MRSSENEAAVRILNYWRRMEFLSQESYPDVRRICAAAGEHKLAVSRGILSHRAVTDFLVFHSDDPSHLLIQFVRADMKFCMMRLCGPVTVYIGRVRRSACVRRLAKYAEYQENLDFGEEGSELIACASLQITPEGRYVPKSLSLSPLLWTIEQMRQSCPLTEEDYRMSLIQLEERLDLYEGRHGKLLTTADMKRAMALIEDEYVPGNLETFSGKSAEPEEIIGGLFQMFLDETAMAVYQSAPSGSFAENRLTEELRTISGFLEAGGEEELPILRYLNAFRGKEERQNRIDVLYPRSAYYEDYKAFLRENMRVADAPEGKWPASEDPEFLRQLAVNLSASLAASRDHSLFSVNTPAGTGRTEVIRDLAADHIVKRALLLAEYADPDDAFEADPAEGTVCFRFRNDRLNHFAMTAVSRNPVSLAELTLRLNELPQEEQISAEELKSGIGDVLALWKISETPGGLLLQQGVRELCGSENGWLISAPAGEAEECGRLYQSFLHLFSAEDELEEQDRLKTYQEARDEFLKQAETVQSYRDALHEHEALFSELYEVSSRIAPLKEDCRTKQEYVRSVRLKTQEAIRGYREEILQKEQQIRDQKEILSQLQEESNRTVALLQEADEAIREAEAKAEEAGKAVGPVSRVLRTSAYRIAKEEEETWKQEASDRRQEEELLRRQFSELTDQRIQEEQEIELVKAEIVSAGEAIQLEEETREQAEAGLRAAYEERQKAELRLEELRGQIDEMYMQGKMPEADRFLLLDDAMIEQLNSRTGAGRGALKAPWLTRRYNREREKLFLMAVRLNREFAAASRACRINYSRFGSLFGYGASEFSEASRREDLVTAFQCLSLVVPVLTMTIQQAMNLFAGVLKPDMIGTLVLLDGGTEAPRTAAGVLFRSRHVIVMGDPAQLGPQVRHEEYVLRNEIGSDLPEINRDQRASVQTYADEANLFGASLKTEYGTSEWVGCPLRVQRRSISPIFEISNEIAYCGRLLKGAQMPDRTTAGKLIYPSSRWISIPGSERDSGSRYVEAQGEEVCRMLEASFRRVSERGDSDGKPDLFIMSPFESVVQGVRDAISRYCRQKGENTKIDAHWILNETCRRIGTTRDFLAEEADEVIFVLGCDSSSEGARAISLVGAAEVNTALTRAKYCAYVIADETVWRHNAVLNTVKHIMDTLGFRRMKEIERQRLSAGESDIRLREAVLLIPGSRQFTVTETKNPDRISDYDADTSYLVRSFETMRADESPDPQLLALFGIREPDALQELPEEMRDNLLTAVYLYGILEPAWRCRIDADGGAVGVLLFRVMELQVCRCFADLLRSVLPEQNIITAKEPREIIRLKDAVNDELTLGVIDIAIRANLKRLGSYGEAHGCPELDEAWWNTFEKRLNIFRMLRRDALRSGMMRRSVINNLISLLFRQNANTHTVGLMMECENGRKLLAQGQS